MTAGTKGCIIWMHKVDPARSLPQGPAVSTFKSRGEALVHTHPHRTSQKWAGSVSAWVLEIHGISRPWQAMQASWQLCPGRGTSARACGDNRALPSPGAAELHSSSSTSLLQTVAASVPPQASCWEKPQPWSQSIVKRQGRSLFFTSSPCAYTPFYPWAYFRTSEFPYSYQR